AGLPLSLGHVDRERMVARVQWIWIAIGEEIEPGRDLSLIAQERREEAMEPGRHTTVDQGGEPRDRRSRRHEQKPDGEHDMLRHDEHDAKKRSQAATPKRYVAEHDETTYHARYRRECADRGLT